jgi:hypothetical protein
VIPTAVVVAGGVALLLVVIGLVVYLTVNSPGLF